MWSVHNDFNISTARCSSHDYSRLMIIQKKIYPVLFLMLEQLSKVNLLTQSLTSTAKEFRRIVRNYRCLL